MICVRYGFRYFLEDKLIGWLLHLIIKLNAKWLRTAHKAENAPVIYHQIEGEKFKAMIHIALKKENITI